MSASERTDRPAIDAMLFAFNVVVRPANAVRSLPDRLCHKRIWYSGAQSREHVSGFTLISRVMFPGAFTYPRGYVDAS
jgi:hypothetical protein